MKNKKGITLIALVITIIVLLILAGVSLSLVLGENGILNQAQKSVKDHSEAEVIEQIKLAHSAYEMAKAGGTTETAEDFIRNRLKEALNDNSLIVGISDSTGEITVKTNVMGKTNEYKYNPQTGDSELVAKWIDNGDWSYTNTITGIKVQLGDFVNYDEQSNGILNYTTDISKGICGSLGNSGKRDANGKYVLNTKTYETENLTWRVLGLDQRGLLKLISEDPMSSENKVYLANEEGYLYGPGELDKMCNCIYGKGKGAFEARSLNLEDIQELTGIKTEQKKKELNNEYGLKYTYRFPTEEEVTTKRYMQHYVVGDVSYSGRWLNNTDKNEQTFRMPGIDNMISIDNPGYSPEIVRDLFNIDNLSDVISTNIGNYNIISQLITKGTSDRNIDQWLSSSCCGPFGNFAPFNIRILTSGTMGNCMTYLSTGKQYSFYARVRPVVTLKSDINLSGNSTEGWTIQ